SGTIASTGSALTLGTGNAGTIAVTGALSSAFATQLSTGTGGAITANGSVSSSGSTSLSADNIAIPGGTVSGANVTIGTAGSAVAVDLGSAGTGAFLFDNAALNRISTTGTFTLNAGSGFGGTINVNAPIAITNSANVAFNAGTLNVTGTASAPGNFSL